MRLLSYMNLKNVALLAVGVKLAGFYSVALALEGDVIRPYVSATYSYDDNLRRFSNKQQALISTGSTNTSDTILMTGVGIILDKEVSQQRFYFDISANRTKFDRNSELNNDGKEMTGRWDWRIGKHLEGKAELYHKEALVPFSDFQGLALNTRTINRRTVDGKWLFHPRWRLRSSLMNVQTEYSATSQQVANLDEDSQELGVDYVSPSKSLIGVLYRHVKGTRPAQIIFGVPISNDYEQDELKLNVDWTVTGKTKIQFLGGLVDRKHDQLSQRDFRKFNARGNVNWLPTGKTGLNLSIWRENNAQSFVTTSYTLNTGTSVVGSYYLTNKITLQGNAKYEKRDFEGDAIFQSNRSDKDKNFSVSVIYKPTLSLMLNASLMHSTRDSTSDMLSFKSNAVSLTGQYEF